MFKTNVALAAGLCLALTTVSASAGELSFESRGYGGPLYVGPNFQQGGQWSPPVYGQGSKSSRSERYVPERRERSVAKSHKAPTQDADSEKAAAKDTSVEKADSENSTITGVAAPTINAETSSPKPSSTDKMGESENSAITSAALQTDNTDAATSAEAGPKAEAASASPATCKRFIAAAGKTVTVPCD